MVTGRGYVVEVERGGRREEGWAVDDYPDVGGGVKDRVEGRREG